jgi:hypothetical protein
MIIFQPPVLAAGNTGLTNDKGRRLGGGWVARLIGFPGHD